MSGQKIDPDSIKVKDRLREDLGDIEGLAASIKAWGLLHPIVIDEKRRLVAGARRLAACKLLGFRRVDVSLIGDLSDSERREIELDENLKRKDLTAYEESKHKKSLAEAAEETATEEEEVSATSAETPKKGGRPKKGKASKEAVAEEAGIPESTIRLAQEHVAACERYKFLQEAQWSQNRALATAKALDALPAPDRRKIVSLIEGVHGSPRDILKMAESFERATPEVRAKTYDMARGEDPRDRSAAIVFLAQTAPEPDPRAGYLHGVAKKLKFHAERFAGDPMNEKIERLASQAEKLADEIQVHQKKRYESLEGAGR
jgi:ParB-like chromosome segregation protein Spo0J